VKLPPACEEKYIVLSSGENAGPLFDVFGASSVAGTICTPVPPASAYIQSGCWRP